MKRNRFVAITVMMLMLCISFVSCGKDEYESRIHELIIKKELVFEADEDAGYLSSTQTFRNEDLTNYLASSDSRWCKVSIDATASTLTVTVEENNTFDQRQATVTITDILDPTAYRTFTVKQKQNDVIMVADDSSSYLVATDGGQVVINLESNVSYKVQIQNADWITLPSSGTRGLQKSQVVLNVARNNTEASRSAQVLISDDTSGAKTLVLITQEFKPYLRVAETNYTFDEHGGEFDILVEANISFDCNTVPEDSWVKKKGNRVTVDDNTFSQKITIAALTEKTPKRTSTISVENLGFASSGQGDDKFENTFTINITQTRNIYIQESSIKLLTTGSQKLTLYNANNEAVLWKSSDESIATVDDEGKVTGTGAGTTTITVASADGVHTDQVTVTVERPADLKDKFVYEWQSGYSVIDGVGGILTSISCNLTNNSDFDIQLVKVAIYQDGNIMTSTNFDAASGALAKGATKKASFDIPIEREEVKPEEPENPDPEDPSDTPSDDDENPSDEPATDEPSTDEPATDGGTPSASRTRAEGDDEEAEVVLGAPIVNTHVYTIVWEYTYSGEVFSLSCSDPEKRVVEPVSAARKNYRKRR